MTPVGVTSNHLRFHPSELEFMKDSEILKDAYLRYEASWDTTLKAPDFHGWLREIYGNLLTAVTQSTVDFLKTQPGIRTEGTPKIWKGDVNNGQLPQKSINLRHSGNYV